MLTETNREEAITLIKQVGATWPTPYVARAAIGEFPGGLMSRKYLSNLDCKNEGPEGSFKIGKGTVYPVDKLCDWLIAKVH